MYEKNWEKSDCVLIIELLIKKLQYEGCTLPLPDEVQDRLSRATVFLTLDLRCGYWQVPVPRRSRRSSKDSLFCPGPGMGLYEFCCMPCGLRGAPGSFQRLMDKIFHSLSFVVIYLDYILIYSENVTQHTDNLHQGFGRLQSAGLHS